MPQNFIDPDFKDLTYDFPDEECTDNILLDALTEVRNGLVKEVIEAFGSDMGEVNKKRQFITTFKRNLDDEALYGLPKENDDDLVMGMLRYAHALGYDNEHGDGLWGSAVMQMAAWYVSNIHDYSQTKFTPCPLVNRNVRHDCSGFITACLWKYGALANVIYPPASSEYTNGDSLGAQLTLDGFEKIPFSWDTVKPFDIITYNGHIEIYNGIINGKHTSWAWGNNHDIAHGGLPCSTVKKQYTYIWRNKFNGSMADVNDSMFNTMGPIAITSGQTKINAMKLMNDLMSSLSLTKAQAAGIAGVIAAESGINPQSFNKNEKAGTYRSSSANNMGQPYGHKNSPWSYGAGMVQWTFTDRKEKALMGGLGISRAEAIAIIKGAGIESLTLEQQTSMLIYELTTTYRYTLQGIKKCSTASQSAATYYCHAVAGYSSSTQPATQAEINRQNAKYSKVGASSQINKAMAYAEGLMKE